MVLHRIIDCHARMQMPLHQPPVEFANVILAITIVQLIQHSYVYHDLQTVLHVQVQLATNAQAVMIATLMLLVTPVFVIISSMIQLLVPLQWSVVLAMGDEQLVMMLQVTSEHYE